MKSIISVLLFSLLFASAIEISHGHTPNPTPLPGAETSPTAGANTVTEANPEPTPLRHITDEFPNYHPLVVHFPIVLLIIAAPFQVLSFFIYRREFGMATLLLLLLGTVSVWLASNTFHAHPAELPANIRTLFEEHELMATYTWWLALAALTAKSISHFFLSGKWWSERSF